MLRIAGRATTSPRKRGEVTKLARRPIQPKTIMRLLPDRQITNTPHFRPVQPIQKKYFCFSESQITAISLAIPSSLRGAFRDRHGRWERDAMDAGGAADERADLRTAKSCGPDAPTLASSRRSNPPATVANKPGHRGEPEGNR
jgi:hypothetical protein